MTTLPITHMTLYKHGVGFFERCARLTGDTVALSFRVEAMNDVLKSLTAIDRGAGQVLGIEYTTPQTREERLAGCSIRLSDGRSLQDLLVSLRGRHVRLLLDQQEALSGTLVGLDEAPEKEPLATALVSVLLDDSNWVQTAPLGRVQGVEVLDERGAGDLRFFLQTALTSENYRTVTVRLSPGEHDLSVSYIAPAPTWRVSYRLVVEEEEEKEGREVKEGKQGKAGKEGVRQALLMGWGIFDNRLEEDLQGISLALVAGMPISFVYDLYTPFTPKRPEMKEEGRVAAAPVAFEEAVPRMAPAAMGMAAMETDAAAKGMLRAAAPARRAINADALEATTHLAMTGADLGELFQYTIVTPVTVGRGQSAMVPIVSSRLAARKDLLYNNGKQPLHPVATLRLKNETGLTLERGPVTVLENGVYAGEALLPFTVADSELVIPYAVELGAKVREESGAQREMAGLRISGYYLVIEEWDIRWRTYQVNNSTGRPLTVLVEHPRTAHFELFDTPEAVEQTADHLRFAVTVPARGEETLWVQERRLVSRREELRRQSSAALQGYLGQGLLERHTHDQLLPLLEMWERIAAHEQRLAEIEKERASVYKAQEQIQGNMKALATAGKEGELRASYVDKLRASEQQLQALAGEEQRLKVEIQQLKDEIDARIKALE